MKDIYFTASNIISPLGFTTESNISKIAQEQSGIEHHNSLGSSPYYASIINDTLLDNAFSKIGNTNEYSKLEKMMILSLTDTINQTKEPISNTTALIIATTKGNIDSLETNLNSEQAYLPELAKKIQDFFLFKNEPIIISNACVSGILAIAVAKRFIQNNYYDNAFIVAGDIVSKFTLSGFQSFQAISEKPCKPFSKFRNGITIGEAAASAFITNNKTEKDNIQIIGDGSCNDANHISGPSRTGEGLYNSVISAFDEANITPESVNYISAHGTATLYNDEMEAIAFNRLNLSKTPVNSFKGYYGHTLGASGLLEAIIGIESMKANTLYSSLGIDELGVSVPLNIIKQKEKVNINTFLKTASGFGGCNTAVLFKKTDH